MTTHTDARPCNTRPADPWLLPVRVMRVIDGDTYDVQIVLAGKAFGLPLYHDRVRLMGADTYEMRGAERELGLKARAAVVLWLTDQGNEHMAGYWLGLRGKEDRELDRGKYGRLIGDIFCPRRGQWISDVLTLGGHAK